MTVSMSDTEKFNEAGIVTDYTISLRYTHVTLKRPLLLPLS